MEREGLKNLSVCEVLWTVQFSHLVTSSSLRPHGLQHTRPPCPSPSPGVYSYSCPFSQWCHPTISSSVIPLSLLLRTSIFSSISVFSNESALHIRWPKYWSFSFSISPSNEYLGLISFRMDWLDLLAVQGTLKSLLQHHSSKASILWWSWTDLTTKCTWCVSECQPFENVWSIKFAPVMLNLLTSTSIPRTLPLLF